MTNNDTVERVFPPVIEFDELACRLPANFWNRVDRSGDCWIWGTRRDSPKNYPEYCLGGRRKAKAHRMVLEAGLGRPLRPGFEACHTCDVKQCVRLSHLYEGTHHHNMQDAADRGLTVDRSRCANGHIRIPENTGTRSDGRQQCLTCRAERDRRRAEERGYNYYGMGVGMGYRPRNRTAIDLARRTTEET